MSKGLVGNAEGFLEKARQLREQKEREASGAKASVEHTGERANNFVDAAADLNAKVYSEARIMPEIDSLVNAHTDGKPISIKELEATYKNIMLNMVEDGVLTKEEMDAYIAPQKIERTVEVEIEAPSILQKAGARLRGEQKVFENRKVIEDGPSQFQNDIKNSMQFNKQGQVEAPNLASLKDKVLYGLSKICTNLGFSSLSKACRNAISVDNQEKINKIEAGAVNMVQKVTEKAKKIGSNIDGPSKATRISKQTKNIVANRQKQDSGRVM
jgi:hypothetical protein